MPVNCVSLQEEVGALDDAVPVHYYPKGVDTVSASTSRPLDASNKGYQLLQRLGWRGKGLGRNEHGAWHAISTPVASRLVAVVVTADATSAARVNASCSTSAAVCVKPCMVSGCLLDE